MAPTQVESVETAARQVLDRIRKRPQAGVLNVMVLMRHALETQPDLVKPEALQSMVQMLDALEGNSQEDQASALQLQDVSPEDLVAEPWPAPAEILLESLHNLLLEEDGNYLVERWRSWV